MSSDFTHLHIHSMGSILDGFPTPSEIVDRAIKIGSDSIAITDHGSMATALQFHDAALNAGIKPIIGMEGYLAHDLTSRDKNDPIYHIGLLAQNYKGYQNLCKISDIAWNRGFYKKPRIDFDVLRELSEGIIVLSGCMDGVISNYIRGGDNENAYLWAKAFKESLGERFFMEVQPWNPDNLNGVLYDIAEKLSIPVVATADAHYCNQEDLLAEEVSLLIQQTTEMNLRERADAGNHFAESRARFQDPLARINFLYPNRKLRFDKINNYIMKRKFLEERMLEAGWDFADIYDNTLLVSEMVEEYEIPRGVDYLPKFIKKMDSHQYLEELAFDKLADKGLQDNEEYVTRLKEELEVIKLLKFADYILIIWDACNWAHSQGIRTGPGRGSVGGSLLAYVLGITRVDPMVHGLLFWRFLNVEEGGKSARVEPPDIDTDVEDVRRDEIKNYLQARWKNVASISAFAKFSSKGMVRDISRVFAIPLPEVNAVCKHFEDLDGFLTSEKTKSFRDKYPEIVSLAKKFEGRWRFLGVHAAGVVVANEELNNILPLESRTAGIRGKERIRVTAFDMDDVQATGLIKMDFLGLSALTIINDCEKMIYKRHKKRLDLDSLPLDDERVLNEFSEGHTVGVFQVDTSSYNRLLKDLKVDSFADLAASNALVRPGPLLTVTPQYIARKHGREIVPKEHELMQAITSDTYGLIIYQEQLMQALVDIGGFTKTEADKVRKIIGKKRDENEFKPFESKWIENASQLLGKARATKLWKDFLKFAGYAFNKAHAVEYSVLSYQTMWLKTYYPLEYMYALLKNETKKDKITTFLFEAERLGIKIKMPDVNNSDIGVVIEGDDSIRFGLTSISGVGETAAEEIITHQPYESFEDFLEKISRRRCSQKVIDKLLEVGAFKDIHDVDIDYESNYYELLGLAQSLDKNDCPVPFTLLADTDTKELETVFVLVKDILRRPDWARMQVEDSSGSSSYFCRADYEIEPGRVVVAMVYGSDWIGYTYLEDLIENMKTGNYTPFERYLLGETFGEEKSLLERGFGGFDTDRVLMLPLHVRIFKVKNGKNIGKSMAIMIGTDGNDVRKVTVFPKSYANCAPWLKAFEPIVLKKQLMRDGTITVEEDGIRLARRLMEEKKLYAG